MSNVRTKEDILFITDLLSRLSESEAELVELIESRAREGAGFGDLEILGRAVEAYNHIPPVKVLLLQALVDDSSDTYLQGKVMQAAAAMREYRYLLRRA